MSFEKKVIRIGKKEGKTKKEKIESEGAKLIYGLSKEEHGKATLARDNTRLEEKLRSDIKAFQIKKRSELPNQQKQFEVKQKLEKLFKSRENSSD